MVDHFLMCNAKILTKNCPADLNSDVLEFGLMKSKKES